MLAAAKQGQFQIILCKSQSRFTRDMELVEKYIHGLFPLWGIRFVAVADYADTEIRGNKKARQINGLINEWYLEDLSENVRMVLDLKRQEGKYIGGSPLYGYRKDPADKNRLLVDPEAAAVVRRIFRWSLEGRSKQSIASMLNAEGIPSPARYKAERGQPGGREASGGWTRTAVGRILTNEMYAGVMVQGRRRKVSYKSRTVVSVPRNRWYRVEGTHESIIDRAAFEAVQRNLALRSRADGSGAVYALGGLVKCMDCGSTMSRTAGCRQDGASVSYLRCSLYAGSGSGEGCTRHSIRLDRLTGLVSDRICRCVQSCGWPDCRKDLLERAGERLKKEPLPRELAAALVEKIEIGERNPDTGEQQVRITWKF